MTIPCKKTIRIMTIISTMNRTNDDIEALVRKVNVQSDTIVINQSTHMANGGVVTDFVESTPRKNGFIRVIHSKSIGIGRSRNRGILASKGSIFKNDNRDNQWLLFADDDITYVEDYPLLVIKAIEQYPEADMFVFNTNVTGLPDGHSPDKQNVIAKKLHWYNCLGYGAVRIAVKQSFLEEHNIWFSLEHGGGAKYSSGEDTLFIHDCLKAGAKIVAIPEVLCKYSYEESTWFTGYNEKYFYDRGVLFRKLYGRGLRGYFLLLAITTKNKDKLQELGFKKAWESSRKGFKGSPR